MSAPNTVISKFPQNKMGRAWRRAKEFVTAPVPLPRDGVDLFRHRKARSEFERTLLSLLSWSPRDVEKSEEGAARFALGLLRENPRLRRKFADALTAGVEGKYCRWLLAPSARWKFSPPGRAHLRAAFASRFGTGVIDLFLHSAELRSRFPGALLPTRQKRFVQWLVKERRLDHGVTDVEILSFLHQTATDTIAMMQLTWSITPSWQETFPASPPPAKDWRDMIASLDDRAPDAASSERKLDLDTPPRAFVPPNQRGVNLLA
ncbi:MAG: hypothetical protein M3R59_09485, partial [Verrucomicrobiota bacterium]|nr:hypothetical protein [Verrucomicrobiota bacterium]